MTHYRIIVSFLQFKLTFSLSFISYSIPFSELWLAHSLLIQFLLNTAGFEWNSDELLNTVGAVLQCMDFIGIYCYSGSAYDLNSAKDRVDYHELMTSRLTIVKQRSVTKVVWKQLCENKTHKEACFLS